MDWSWIIPTSVSLVILPIIVFFLRKWYQRRGTTVIHIGDREPPQYITNGERDQQYNSVRQRSPRFMNFRIPLTIENDRGIAITIRVKNVWFSEGRPIIHKDGEWELPGSNLEPTGIEIRSSAGNIVDPIKIDAYSIEHVLVIGTATSPVCHVGPYMSWRYLFIDWITIPIRIDPIIQEVDGYGEGRSLDPHITPNFALPEHYPKMQG